ncbi:aldehyde dehydrogenase [Actinomadura sp. KC345]|uniref:aldehyde dehydrogenase family protein n=1 Tax=Actinomadura sp. KC345 TaxID=2530371 RepID=UPI00104B79EF|nr:aldehyde dehydrogenase family protein [Actinomadura sp. KC345]TDC57913.1 aldehyde dehydrogenase [Actinomadura sp. KC345]
MTGSGTVRNYACLVAGERLTTKSAVPVLDPYTEPVIGEAAEGDRSTVDAAVATAVAAQEEWARTPLSTRRRVLDLAADILDERRDELVDLAIADTGARRPVAAELQVGAPITRLRAWARQPDDVLGWAAADRDGLGGRVTRTPVGVVGCISPSNFPMHSISGKVAPALFAGNTVVMKPAPQDPLLVSALAAALNSALAAENAPAGAVNLVLGTGPETGAALAAHPDARAISFTGSTAVGTAIYRSGAESMKRLLLELGGKGALIVRHDADLDSVIAAVTRTWTIQAGQVCLTPARILADRRIHDDLLARLRAALAELVHGDPRDATTTVGPLVSADQQARVTALTDTARREGATVETASGVPSHGWFHPATLVSDCRPEQTVMQEDVFGPVLCVMPTSDDDEAVDAANSTRYGLTDYVFSRNVHEAEAVAGRLDTAQVAINTVRRHPDLPFGGNKASGLGRSGGTYALDSYTDLRAVVTAESH